MNAHVHARGDSRGRRVRRGAFAAVVLALATSGAFVHDAGALKTSITRVSAIPRNQTVGNPQTLRAYVAGSPMPTGTVEFFEGATSLGTAPLVSRYATVSVSFPLGTHIVTAVYSGDSTWAPSTSAGLSFIVGYPSKTKAVLQYHSVPASPVSTWTATTHVLFVGNVGIQSGQINYGFRTGTATVQIDGVTNYEVTLDKNRIILDFPDGLGAGPHTAVATYHGDIHYLPNTSTTRRFTINP